ncbi:hypothetical protein SAMN05444372_11922 [Flavobacterium micromati]|uniref:Uncharacterized protein n=1 Tax=Flavobacterium micromati TaxID=229205 RepID=A0A1M5QT75_9FLAO|nr:DUF6090 family protein [Flavobacterium micromati]SHH17066.1 hypothetical protein SAMN05444372_11922 [Flavobacterium micromati]
MQDEIIKHSKKLHSAMINKSHSTKEKVTETVIEIFIIVFAVSLSIWLHSWSEHKHEQKEVAVFLSNLRSDLQNDIKILDQVKGEYAKTNIGYEKLLALTPLQLDSIQQSKAIVHFPVNSQGRKLNTANYEAFKSSGKIGYIEDEVLKQKILTYYQERAPITNEVDKIYNDFLFKCFDKMIENADKSDAQLYADPKFKKSLFFLVRVGKNNIRAYDENVRPEAIKLIKEIENELNK